MHDASHDFTHIERLLVLAERILKSEQETNPEVSYDPTIVTLGVLMHDVGDRKYRNLPQRETEDANTIIATTLISLGASSSLASYVQIIAHNVSHFRETQNPAHVREVLRTHPELVIVQDADQLDAIGAAGIAWILTFSATTGRRFEDALSVFEERLYSLTEKMKTAEGRRLAVIKTERTREFERWAVEEGIGGSREERSG